MKLAHIGILFIFAWMILPESKTFAEETITVGNVDVSPSILPPFNNENWSTLTHPLFATFTMHSDGTISGLTENGIPFKQYSIPNEAGMRIQRFEMQDHYHYIVEGEIVYTSEELSARLAQGYREKTEVPSV